MEDEPISVRYVAYFSREFHYNYREQLNCTAIVAGYDNIKGGQVYAIPMGGYVKQLPYYVTGSGGTFIHQFIGDCWVDDMEGEKAREVSL